MHSVVSEDIVSVQTVAAIEVPFHGKSNYTEACADQRTPGVEFHDLPEHLAAQVVGSQAEGEAHKGNYPIDGNLQIVIYGQVDQELVALGKVVLSS